MALTYETTQREAKDAAFERLLRESIPRLPTGATVPRADLEIIANAMGDATGSLLRSLLVDGIGGGAGSVTEVATGDGLSGGPITGAGTISVNGTVARWGAALTATRVAFMGGAGALVDDTALTFNVGTGTLSATAFSGNGAALTNLTAANIAAGTAGINISGNAANVTGTVVVANGGTGATSFTATRLLFMGGAGIVVDAAALTFDSGTGALSATSFVGSGAALTGLTERTTLAGTTTITSPTDVIAWGGELAATDYPAGRAITFAVTATVTGAGLTGTVTLYNITAAAIAATLSFTWTGSAVPATQTATVTLSGTAAFELRTNLSGYVSAPDALQIYAAELVVR